MKKSQWFDRVSGFEHSGKEAHIIFEVIHANRVLLSAFASMTGIPASQLVLMRILAGAGDTGIGVLEIARIMGVNGAAVTRQVKKMESQGLIVREADKEDGRRCNLKLTSQGFALVADLHQQIHQMEDRLISDIPKKDIETAIGVIGRLRTALTKNY